MFIGTPSNESFNKRQLQKYLYPPLKGLRTDALPRFWDFFSANSYFTPSFSRSAAACLKSWKHTA